jgi:hypothetical protein
VNPRHHLINRNHNNKKFTNAVLTKNRTIIQQNPANGVHHQYFSNQRANNNGRKSMESILNGKENTNRQVNTEMFHIIQEESKVDNNLHHDNEQRKSMQLLVPSPDRFVIIEHPQQIETGKKEHLKLAHSSGGLTTQTKHKKSLTK